MENSLIISKNIKYRIVWGVICMCNDLAILLGIYSKKFKTESKHICMQIFSKA
jgi:hypothetical protein